MITRRMIQVCLQLVVALLVLSAAHPVTAGSVTPENIVPGKVESLAQRLMHDLKKQGYEVARGYVRLYTPDDCGSSYAVMGSCFGNNPAAPYVIPVVPSWPDEWVDPATAGAFGPTKKGYSVSYRFARAKRSSSWACCPRRRNTSVYKATCSPGRVTSIRRALSTSMSRPWDPKR